MWSLILGGKMEEQYKLHQKDKMYKKLPNSSYNWTEKYVRRVQQQNGWGRMYLWAGRQKNVTHPDTAAKWRKNFKMGRYMMRHLRLHQV